MPIYEYRCQGCEEKFELLIRSSSDEKNQACPKCSGTSINRMLSTFAVGAAAPSSNGGGGGGMCQSVCAPAGRCMRD
jgi:putative FmdB family regulatory protein